MNYTQICQNSLSYIGIEWDVKEKLKFPKPSQQQAYISHVDVAMTPS